VRRNIIGYFLLNFAVAALTNIRSPVQNAIQYRLHTISASVWYFYYVKFTVLLQFPMSSSKSFLAVPSPSTACSSHSLSTPTRPTNQSKLLFNISTKMANLKVTLINPLGSTSPRPHEAICVSRRSDGETQKLEISLRRTIRVPDNGDVYELPPDMGAFPIYNVREYDSKLPLALVEKGGVFIPMFRTLEPNRSSIPVS
jgi:hypothetical protein